MAKIAIVGAGLAGISLARKLKSHHQVVLFEKSRGLGGRLATRRHDLHQWDHGAPFITARTPEFSSFLQQVCQDTMVEWQARLTTLSTDRAPYKRDWFEPHWIGTPSMSRALRRALGDLPCHLSQRVQRLQRRERGWVLLGEDWESDAFDQVVLTCPAAQCSSLLPETFPQRELVESVSMLPCFALMLAFAPGGSLPSWQAAVIQGQVLSWGAWEQCKPGRPQAWSLLLHANRLWSGSHVDQPLEWVKDQMLEEFWRLSGLRGSLQLIDSQIHRWRFAFVEKPLTEITGGDPFLWDANLGLGACGDWCHGPRAESAFLSSQALAEALLC